MPEVDELGAWRNWPGRWGNSKGVLAQLGVRRLGGESPRSPAHQGERWERPADYHVGSKGPAPISRAAHTAGTLTYPRLASLSARLDGQELILDYALESRPLAGASLLYVTVHDNDGLPAAVLLSTTVTITERSGEARVHLPEPVERCVVYASGFNRLRQRSDVLHAVAMRSS